MKILIAIDGSECSAYALRSVAERLWPEGSQFRLITVMESLYGEYAYGGAFTFERMYDTQKQMITEARTFLEDKVADMRLLFGDGAVSQVLFEGSVADAIIGEAKQWDADLIVLGTHGKRGLQRFLLGSVAEKVASYATCSVEIVKDKNVFQVVTKDASKAEAAKELVKTKTAANNNGSNKSAAT